MPVARFAVGDKAEYWSDTYQQWMPGTVQRVRDGGAVYDLDVKKGAQASKLRMSRSSPTSRDADTLFSAVDSNHDGVISRSEFQGALQSHVIEGSNISGLRSADASLSVALLPPQPPSTPGRTGKASSLSASLHSRHREPSAALELSGSRRRPLSRDRSDVSSSRREPEAVQIRRPGGVLASVSGHSGLSEDKGGRSPRSTALQAKQLHEELAQATRAIQAQNGEWAEAAGEDMVSRAGAVTVRKLVETTKALLQGLEGALILRAGFIAGCFHMWRCETTLSRAGRLYQEEFERHHDQWAAHLDHHKKSFEAELRAHAEQAMARREKVQLQRALLLDQWAHGDRQGLLRESLRAWCKHAAMEKRLKCTAARIHQACYTWCEGKTRGTLHSCLNAWRHLQLREYEGRRRDQEMEDAKGLWVAKAAEEQRKHDREIKEKLLAIEARHCKGRRDVEVVLAKWERGSQKGCLLAAFKAWAPWARKKASAARRAGAVELQLKKWLEGQSRGQLHTTWLHWRGHAKDSRAVRRQEEALARERAILHKMMADQEKAHQTIMAEKMSELDKLHERQKNAVEVALMKWEGGDKKGLLKSTLKHWRTTAKTQKSAARKRQAVHAAMLKALEGDRRAAMSMSFMNWSGLAKSEKQARLMEERVEQETKQWQSFLEETQRDHEAKLKGVEATAASLRMQAHQAMQCTVAKWLEGEKLGLQHSIWQAWKKALVMRNEAEKNRAAVKDSLLRYAEGEALGIQHSVFQAWKNNFLWEIHHHGHMAEKDAKIERLEQQAERLLDHHAQKLRKYGVLAAEVNGVPAKGMCFTAWKEETKGIQANLEAQRERDMRIEELQRQHKMHADRHQEERALALDALGAKNNRRVKLFEHFFAWALLVQTLRENFYNHASHNEVMQQYSEFIIRQMLKKNSENLLASSFAEWHREGRILFHQRGCEDALRSADEQRAYVAQLEQRAAELQEQLGIYYQQIDLITETLQKELKTKEELAAELRAAYNKMRKSNFTPSTAATAQQDLGALSRSSSDQTIDQVVSTPRKPTGGAFGGNTSVSSSVPAVSLRLGEMPPCPAIPRCADLLRGRSAQGGKDSLGASLGHSRDGSPSQCDWNQAVERMGEEGIVHTQQ